MRPDAQQAMHVALVHGPSDLPPDLFAGDAQRVLLGMKAHANTIAHARFVAMEETYPHSRALMGPERFHRLSAQHLADRQALARPLASIGEGFADCLSGAEQDLARVEWNWLAAHSAADAPPFDLHAISGLGAEQLAEAPIRLHPATRLVTLSHSIRFGSVDLEPPLALITRPYAEVQLLSTNNAVARLADIARAHCTIATLLEADAESTTLLIRAGALTLSTETP